MWSLNLSKESFKFSGAHFTTFSAEEGERLHGHNYYVSVSINSSKKLTNGMIVDLLVPKTRVLEVLEPLDEKVLLPQESQFIELSQTETNYEVLFNSKFYSFPIEDCEILPTENITIEGLASYIAEELAPSFKPLGVDSYSVSVEETKGQSSTYTLDLKTYIIPEPKNDFDL